jgi:hypothetical protein
MLFCHDALNEIAVFEKRKFSDSHYPTESRSYEKRTGALEAFGSAWSFLRCPWRAIVYKQGVKQCCINPFSMGWHLR